MSINIPTAYITNIRIPFGELQNHIRWCQDNCEGDWKFGEHPDTMDSWTHYNFYFELERDYVAYTLWMK
jgi:hypothetical protein